MRVVLVRQLCEVEPPLLVQRIVGRVLVGLLATADTQERLKLRLCLCERELCGVGTCGDRQGEEVRKAARLSDKRGAWDGECDMWVANCDESHGIGHVER